MDATPILRAIRCIRAARAELADQAAAIGDPHATAHHWCQSADSFLAAAVAHAEGCRDALPVPQDATGDTPELAALRRIRVKLDYWLSILPDSDEGDIRDEIDRIDDILDRNPQECRT